MAMAHVLAVLPGVLCREQLDALGEVHGVVAEALIEPAEQGDLGCHRRGITALVATSFVSRSCRMSSSSSASSSIALTAVRRR